MLLNRDAILDASDLATEDVECPEWGGTVRVRSLTGRERDAYEASMTQIRGRETLPNLANARAKLVVRACVDDNGERLFSDQDVSALGRKNAAPLDRLFDVAARLSGLSNESVEDLLGNSDDVPSDGSISD